ncbi:DUF2254 domain-containing protein [Szabonella alba]|uniref:DUF2254 domain-containing protein n=1 Tax=Szabonella alba TaxID=2804194 RepID=A0A8K0V9B5_9RHOB|nr:DUF2254 domain-containing protein [Szabonella alba]MBL4915644.1 DUF2254 domain-containing protein [Szabonella alba]
MISRWRWYLRQMLRKLWVIAGLYALLAIITPFLAGLIGPFLPSGLGEKLGSGAVETVLSILASSMLSVVTFSLGIMVSAFGAATSSVTPRATALLKSDRTTQRVLSTFLGAFLYSLIGIIALKAGAYSENDRLVLFIVTALVVAVIVMTILRWIAHLTVFGLMDDSIAKVEKATRDALETRMAAPFLGGVRHDGDPPADALAVVHPDIGYVCNVDMAHLQQHAANFDLRLYLAALPGTFLHPSEPAVWYRAGADLDPQFDPRLLLEAFTINMTRSFDQDPRFGLSVLAEIAERALSSAVNDPGTAIDILGRAVRLLSGWAEGDPPDPDFPRVGVPPLRLSDAFEDVFSPIARDGAGVFSVQIRLQKALLALTLHAPETFGRAARLQSLEAMERCRDKMLASELERLEKVAGEVEECALRIRARPI